MQKLAADATIQSNATGDFLHVCANFFAQIRDLVNECNFSSKKCIRGIFDQLRCFNIRKDYRCF